MSKNHSSCLMEDLSNHYGYVYRCVTFSVAQVATTHFLERGDMEYPIELEKMADSYATYMGASYCMDRQWKHINSMEGLNDHNGHIRTCVTLAQSVFHHIRSIVLFACKKEEKYKD